MSVGTQKSLRKALGALKDTTTVSLAKVNSDYKELDISIVKATNHYERPAKEKHIRAIFAAVSATRPRADVAYCIHALARRLSRTHNWAVALKTLIVIHRALREVDPTFYEEIINYGRTRSHMLNMAHFKDDSGPNAWEYSAWVRAYALFLEERLECFRVLKYDVEMDRPRTKDLDTAEILEQMPALQQLLFRVLGCQPQGAAVNNFVIQLALQLVSSESIRVYQAITDGTANLVDKFFEMKRLDALKALEIYNRACQQAERLSEFYEICKNMDMGRGERFIKIEQPPSSFLQTMEEYVRDAPRVSTALKDQFVDNKIAAPKEILVIEYKKESVVEVEHPPSPPRSEPVKEEEPVAQPPDLLGLDDPVPVASELDEKNALALAIVPVAEQQSTAIPGHANGTTGWELALVSAPSSNESAAAASKLAGGLDQLTLDSLYDDAIRRSNQPVSYNPWEPAPMVNPMMQTAVHDPFFASNMVAAPHSVQMAQMASQQQAFMLQQQQMMGQQQQQPSNPFDNPYGSSVHPYGSDFTMTGAQREHASNIERFVPSLARLRNNLRSETGDGRFWMVYFILLIPRLNERDFEILSTPQIVETRNVLLEKLRNKKNVKLENSNNSISETQGENTTSREEVAWIVNAIESLRMNGEGNSQQFLEDQIDISTSMDNRKRLEGEEVSFSDLEDDYSDFSTRLSTSRKSQSIRAPSPSGSSDWVQLNESSDIPGGLHKARQSFSRDKDSDAESTEWHKVDEFD